jgi:hypothetical protein
MLGTTASTAENLPGENEGALEGNAWNMKLKRVKAKVG